LTAFSASAHEEEDAMTKQTRNAATGLVIVATMSALCRSAAAADGSQTPAAASAPSLSRVRSRSAVVVRVIRDATERSVTFRELVRTIDASDGIVYVEPGRCVRGAPACLVGVMASGPNRILHIKVDPAKEDSVLMGSIGHELRHAVEVLSERWVTDNAAMYLLYDRIGRQRGDTKSSVFETPAAVDTGNAVRDEVRRSMRAAQGR
jgi:hypothetical protein